MKSQNWRVVRPTDYCLNLEIGGGITIAEATSYTPAPGAAAPESCFRSTQL